jgi:hypothetical protein
MQKFTFIMLLAVAYCCALPQATALKFYWKGGSGLFADKNMWWQDSYGSGITAYQQPISTDTVYFTAAAFTSAGGVISINQHVSCAAMIWDPIMPNPVQVTSTSLTWFLDIYGEMRLAQAPNLDFAFRGILRLVSTQVGVVPITSNGQRLRLNKLEIGGTSSIGTRFELQDALYVDDPLQLNHSGAAYGYVNLVNGHFITNGHPLRFDYFESLGNNLTTRGIDISNSYVTIEGSYAYKYHWGINFNSTWATPNYSLFNTANSTIHVKTYSGIAWNKKVVMGVGMAYNNFISDASIYLYGQNTNPITVPTTFNSMIFNKDGYFSHTLYCSANDIYFTAGFTYNTWHRTNIIEAENFHRLGSCKDFVKLEALRGSAVDSRGIIRQRSPNTAFNMSYVMLMDMECDIAGGRTYTVSNSIERGYVPLSPVVNNWIVSGGSGQDFYFVGRNQRAVGANLYSNWSNTNNWDVWNGTAWVPNTSGCLPGPFDNVFIGANSFPTYTAGVITPAATANRGLLAIDTVAYCRRMTWLNDLPNQASMFFVNTGNIFRSEINIYGSAYFVKKMRNINGGQLNFYGNQPDTIVGDSTYMWLTATMQRYSDYHIIGDNDANSLDWRVHTLTSEGPSTLRTNFVQLNVSTFGPNHRIMDSTQVYFVVSGGRFKDNSGTVSYTGNTTFHLFGAFNTPNPVNSVNINAGRLPNVIAYCNANFEHTYFATYWGGGNNLADMNDRKCEVQGDLTLLQNGYFSPTIHPSYFHRLEITGTMAEYAGNVYLSAGKTYEFSQHPTSKFEIKNGALFSIGDCQNMVKLKTVTGEPITFNVAQAAASDVRYTYIEGMNNTGAPLNVANSIDGGNNTNINFLTAGTAVTYYWRRHQSNNRFTGNWSDAAHWTTDPTRTHGENLCIPTILDSVIIDAMSSNAGTGLDSIIINDVAFCGTIWFKANKRTTSLITGIGRLYIGGSMILFNNMPFHNFSGGLYFVGSGDIVTNGTPLKNANIYFNKAGGVWNLRDNFTTSNAISGPYGNLYLFAGRLNTNSHTLDISGLFSSSNSRQLREIYADSSIFEMRSRAGTTNLTLSTPWYFINTNTFRFVAGNSVINFYNTAIPKYYQMGATNATDSVVNYNIVNFYNTGTGVLQGRSNFKYARFMADMQVTYNNSYDSLYLAGGNFFRFGQNTTQTLNSPHGKIIANGSPTSFINIETLQPGVALANRSRFYKAFGTGFCLDFVKVKENRAEKNTLAATPAAWQPLYSLLKFETGVNSDNINGTATGIWDFSLPIPYDPVLVGGTNFNLCAAGNSQTVPLDIKGNGPYVIRGTWSNNLGASGMVSDTVADNDNNANTTFTYNLLVNQMATTTNYNLSLFTLRCGEATPSNSITINVSMPVPNTLVQVQRVDTCFLTNRPTWQTFFDDIDGKPMVSLLDKISAVDVDSLKRVISSVNFTAGVQRLPATSACVPSAPYLERWWKITPQNNVGARVRLYFTAQELLNLTNNTWLLRSGRSLYADSEIMVIKYSSGVVGVGPCQIVPHTLVNWNASTGAPFTSTSGVIGVEFQVTSFSAFVIVPIDAILLSNRLLDFKAELTAEKTTRLDWSVENGQDLRHFVVERAADGLNFAPIAEVAAMATANFTAYHTFDLQPQAGLNYYRLQLVNLDGQIEYSPLRVVELQKAHNFSLFPNPANAQITVSGAYYQNGVAKVELIDALGRTVGRYNIDLQNGDFSQNINLRDLPSAVYMLRLNYPDGSTHSGRFVKD